LREVRGVDRLKNLMIVDRQESLSKIDRLLKAEILYVMKNYFDIVAEELDVSINVDQTGRYNVFVAGKCDNIKIAHLFD
jgi:septum formation topological specificity factor MinE